MRLLGSISICLFGYFLGASEIFGACRLRSGVEIQDMSWAFCSENSLTLFASGYTGKDERSDFLGGVAEGYFGAYMQPRISLHGKGYFKQVQIYDQKADRSGSSDSKVTEQLFLQLGHPLLDKIYGAAGRLPTPFGLNHEYLRHELPTRANVFWDRTVNGLRMSLKLRNDLRLDVGGAWAKRTEIASDEAEALTFRLTENLDLLGGAKLIASYQNHGKREFGKIGLAALVFYSGNTTSLEWVRLADSFSDRSFQQVFRFVHEQINPEATSWSMGFEEIRKDSYRLYGGLSWKFLTQTYFGTAVQYQQLRQDHRQDQWWAVLTVTQNIDFQDGRTRPE